MIFRAIVFSLVCTVFNPVSGQSFHSESEVSIGSNIRKPNEASVSIDENQTQVTIKLDGEMFTTFDFDQYNKPIFYPILGPGQISMTRDWPMKNDTAGESKDHPHHKSMWISHEISGVDF